MSSGRELSKVPVCGVQNASLTLLIDKIMPTYTIREL